MNIARTASDQDVMDLQIYATPVVLYDWILALP